MSNLKMTKKPSVPKELLQWLRQQFPDQVPNLGDTDREVWVKVGNIEVVRHLQKLFEEQEGIPHVLGR